MPLPFMTHQQRVQASGIKLQVWGPAKVGKTSLALTLPPHKTLFLDVERGMLSLGNWKGPSYHPATWEELKDFTCFISGPDPAVFGNGDYSVAHYQRVCNQFGDPRQMQALDHIFIDSTTRIGQMAFAWACARPEARNKAGVLDTRGAYGILKRELMDWAWRLQNAPRLNIVLIGGIKKDDAGQWAPMVDGSAANGLPYVFDIIATMADITLPAKPPFKALVCGTNPLGYPGGDRSGALSNMEPPNLWTIFQKIWAKQRG